MKNCPTASERTCRFCALCVIYIIRSDAIRAAYDNKDEPWVKDTKKMSLLWEEKGDNKNSPDVKRHGKKHVESSPQGIQSVEATERGSNRGVQS